MSVAINNQLQSKTCLNCRYSKKFRSRGRCRTCKNQSNWREKPVLIWVEPPVHKKLLEEKASLGLKKLNDVIILYQSVYEGKAQKETSN
jgi:recombinational DNA repair protein RecR